MKQVAEILNVPEGNISRWTKELSDPRPHKFAELREIARRHYSNGFTLEYIADRLDVAQSTVSRWCADLPKHYGIPQEIRSRIVADLDRKAQLVKESHELSYPVLAKKMGVSINMLTKITHGYNMTRKLPPEMNDIIREARKEAIRVRDELREYSLTAIAVRHGVSQRVVENARYWR